MVVVALFGGNGRHRFELNKRKRCGDSELIEYNRILMSKATMGVTIISVDEQLYIGVVLLVCLSAWVYPKRLHGQYAVLAEYL